MAHWDIFCKVVDNFGDVGTCWRFARQLAVEHGADVRLWIDRIESFAALCPEISTNAQRQQVGPIEVCQWPELFPEVDAADVVIEAFGCDLPESYIAAMLKRSTPPAWINLEYLSAEDWIEGCHRLPSPRTRPPLTKHFFFPGFTRQTGGLLRERGLLADRAAFGAAAEAAFMQSLGVPPRGNGEMRVLLFCYENAALPDLLRCWVQGDAPVTVLAAPGQAAKQVAEWFEAPLLPEKPLRRSALTAHSLPFLRQSDFDRLLWSCDVNFVRGEDSFVRAQWAAKPFVWQIYPQSDDVHWAKLDAFLGRYLADFVDAEPVRRFWHAWNGRGNASAAWADFAALRPEIEKHGHGWAFRLDQMPDLAENLASFVREIKNRQEL